MNASSTEVSSGRSAETAEDTPRTASAFDGDGPGVEEVGGTKRLRIAYIGARGVGATYSGIESYYEEVGSRLAARGHEVTAYCRNYFTPDVETLRGVRVRRLPCLQTKHLETLSHSLLATADSLFRPYDIIQFHAIGSSPLALVPRLFGKTTVVSVRGLDWQRGKWGTFARNALRFGEWASARSPSATAVVSEELKVHYEAAHGCNAVCIPNAIVPAHYREPKRLFEFGLEPGQFVLFAGRLSPEKGIDTLLEAFKGIPRSKTLAIAGGGSYSDDYIDQIRAQGWDEVRFLGNVPRETMDELYSHCLAFVLPSLMEGLSIALLEALSFGCCIITTAIPENLEVVGDAALSFEPGDVAGLRQALDQVLSDPECVERYRAKARARAASMPGWDEVAERTERFYLGLLGRGPSRTQSAWDRFGGDAHTMNLIR